jgi:PilZ domain
MAVGNNENRAAERVSLPLALRVDVAGDDGDEWHENTVFRDVSALGAGFRLKRPIARGRLFSLSTTLPRELRRFDLDLESYEIWAIVRRCVEISSLRKAQHYVIGAAFIGKYPPLEYFSHPKDLYEPADEQRSADDFCRVMPKSPRGAESRGFVDARRHSRLDIPEPLVLRTTDDNGRILHMETTVTENISERGAGVLSQLPLEPGTIVRATFKRTNETIISIVRSRRFGKDDGVGRIHIEFIDKPFYMDGML